MTQPPQDSKPREFWIGYDGVNTRPMWVDLKKPSGISGGGSNRSIHVIEYFAYESLKLELESVKNDVVDLHESGREYFCKNRAAQEKIRELTDKITELSNTLALRDRDIKAMHKAFENISEYQSMLNPNRKNK